MSYVKTEWDNGDIITAEKLNNAEIGIEEINMSYEKQTWSNGDTITAEKLNYMENGISGGGGSNNITITLDVVGNDPVYSEKFVLAGAPLVDGNYITGLFQNDGHYTVEFSPLLTVAEAPMTVDAIISEDCVYCMLDGGKEPLSVEGNVTKSYMEEIDSWVCTITGDCTITAEGKR